LRKHPYYYYRLQQASRDRLNLKELERINDSTETLFNPPAGYSTNQLTDTLVNSYLADMQQMRQLATTHHFDIIFFTQPNPFYHYPNQLNDPVCDQQMYPLVKQGYAVLEKKADSTVNWYFLGNMLQNEKGRPFIDRFHYAPAMCIAIANELVRVVGTKLNPH
jgi:hypothetical protein